MLLRSITSLYSQVFCQMIRSLLPSHWYQLKCLSGWLLPGSICRWASVGGLMSVPLLLPWSIQLSLLVGLDSFAFNPKHNFDRIRSFLPTGYFISSQNSWFLKLNKNSNAYRTRKRAVHFYSSGVVRRSHAAAMHVRPAAAAQVLLLL